MWRPRSAVAGVAAVAAVSLIVGCGADERKAQPEADQATNPTPASTTAPSNSYSWLTTVLPSDHELTTAAGFQIRIGDPPSVGSRLRSTLGGSREVTEEQCLGVISPFEQQVYGAAPVRAVTYATESSLTFGAAALDSTDDARKTFDTFANQWRDCDGKIVVKSDGAYTYEHRITRVDTTADVLSTIDEVTSDSPTGLPVRSQRALGIAKDCIVEVTVPITDSEPNETPTTTSAATDLVKAMLERVHTVRP